ncbi:MAG: cardiolipin synthase [Blastocatellia bacterium]|nr:cardiolipin synthase [Blastocatellia bacterium]
MDPLWQLVHNPAVQKILSVLAILWLVSEWVIRLVMLIVVPFRRTPEATRSWLLFIFFQPWLGLLLYNLIGRPHLPRWRVRKLALLPMALDGVNLQLQRLPNVFQPELPPNVAPAARLALGLGYMPILGGNRVEVLTAYNHTIERLVADIGEATQNVHLIFYIFANDRTGRKVMDALERAVKRGVECRVMLDALGSNRFLEPVLEHLQQIGVEVRQTLPIKWFQRGAARVDLRNHRKIAVIDGKVGYTGSQNIVKATFIKGLVYEDLMVRVEGPIALELQAAFVSDWFLETGKMLTDSRIFPTPTVKGDIIAQGLLSGPGFPAPNFQRMTVALMHGARTRVVITTPYFVPDEAVLQAMETAVLRGVEVHLVVAKSVDQILVRLAQRSYYQGLLEAGVHIHLYRKKFLHAKHLTIDQDIALVGSSNMDIRSFLLNSEFSLLFYGPEVPTLIRLEQERYYADCETLLLEDWQRRSLREKIVENLARLVNPLL